MNKRDKKLLILAWFVLAVIVTLATGFTYVAVQQGYRESANDPQIDLARQVAQAIEEGAPPTELIRPESATDISKTLSPFAAIYDKDGKLLASSGKLGDHDMIPEKAVFDTAKDAGKNYFTWQLDETKIAVVLLPAKDSFVLVGRNLQEISLRIQRLFIMFFAVWLVLLGFVTIFIVLLRLMLQQRNILVENTEVLIMEGNDNTENI